MLNIRSNLTMNEAAELLEGAFRARNLVIMVGDCRVEYEGRASSTLEWGERVTIIKKDGSILVHRPTGYEPVNWQPPKCVIAVSRVEDAILITASRPHPRETITIEFRNISLTAFGSLSDTGEFALHVTEAQMKQAILTAPSLVEEGFRPLEEEKHVEETGFTDIYGVDRTGFLVVIEIKRNAATKDAVIQLQGYLEKIRKRVDRQVRGIIVAPDLRKSAQPMLQNLKIEFVKLAPEKCFKVLKSAKDMKLSQFIS
ncbi:MAG TPA: endonuclease NucS [Methylomirabilota bacterium]|nr:endonuclease NucS [Methylomirabilota bacterium]